ATLAELALYTGDQASPADRELALDHCRRAAQSGAVASELRSRLDWLAALGFRVALLAEAVRSLTRP
ncbi:MAG: hypothetical protein ACRD96_28250, partial [Bryobacteraceae bacterium]